MFEDEAPLYASPHFRDSRHGFLPVKYSGPGKSGEDVSIQALLSTNDGGSTWHLESWSNLDQAANFPIVAVIDSTALAPKRVDHEPPTLLKLGPGGKVSETRASQSPEMPSGAALLSVDFSDVAHGWVSSSNGRLLSTADGGGTWKDITPSPKKTSILAPSSSTISTGSSGMPLQSGAGSGFFLGVVEAKVGMVRDARSAATAAIGESKRTQGHAVLCTERGHKRLLRVEFWDLVMERAGKDAGATS